MRTIIPVTALVFMCMPAWSGQSDVIAKARYVILRHHLISDRELKCSSLVYGVESTPRFAAVTVLERHGGGCPGDVDTSPRRFTLQMDTKTGRAQWDHGTTGEMRPIP